jgi:predicted esterase
MIQRAIQIPTRIFVCVTALVALTTGCSSVSYDKANQGMRPGTGFIQKSATFQARERVWSVFIPNDYTPERRWPAIVFMHGWMQGGSGGVSAVNSGLGPYIMAHKNSFNFITIFPQAKDGWWDKPVDQDDAIRALDDTLAEYNVDPDRVAIVGISTGGYGAWTVGARYRERFSAVVTMGGKSNVDMAPRLAKMPIWCFHYSTDPLMWESHSEEMVQAIEKAGGAPRFTLIPGIGHYVWQQACADNLFEWIADQRRGRPDLEMVQLRENERKLGNTGLKRREVLGYEKPKTPTPPNETTADTSDVNVAGHTVAPSGS